MGDSILSSLFNIRLLFSYGLLLSSCSILGYHVAPAVVEVIIKRHEEKLRKSSAELENMFIRVPMRKLKIMFAISIVVLGILGFMFFKLIGLAVGVALSFFIFPFMIKMKKQTWRSKFTGQLVDGVLLMNSCLKAGLSLIQSIEMLCDDMPPPISQEFSVVLGECKMGNSLDEALDNLNKRLDIEELKFITSAILVARETGGDLPSVLSRLVDTLRDRAKLRENIKTYTLQGRAQGIIMSVIPIFFVCIVLTQNRNHFDIMLTTDIGRALLIAAGILQLLAFVFIGIICKIKI